MSKALLAIRPRALGDLVLTTPAFRALKRGHPDARLEVVTEPHFAPLLAAVPEVDRVWALARRGGAMLRALPALRRTRYDVVADFFGNPRSALLTRLCRARTRAGYDLQGRRYAYDVRVPRLPPAGPRREYAAVSHVRMACAVGGIDDGALPHLVLDEAARRDGRERLAAARIGDPERTVGLVAAGTWGPKTWPLASSALVARGLLAAGYEVLLLCGPGEERVSAALGRMAPGIKLLPPCDVAGLAAVIAHLCAVIGTDSGPRHLAVALSRPTFAWFGPTHPENWTPPDPRHAVWWSDLPCRGCGRTVCPHWNCLPGLEPDHALDLVKRHLDTYARPATDLDSAARA